MSLKLFEDLNYDILRVKENFAKEVRYIFSLPYIRKEILRYIKGIKGESKEIVKAFKILAKYMKDRKVSVDDKKFFRE